jgi:hypothetical protein
MADDQAAPGSRTTGNVPVADVDPGGTRSAPAGRGSQREPIQSGDENANPDRTTGNETPGADWMGNSPNPATGNRSGSSSASGPDRGPDAGQDDG